MLDQVAEGGPVSGITVVPARPSADQADQDVASGGAFRPITDADVAEVEALPEVRDVLPVISTGVYVLRTTERADGTRQRDFVDRMVGVDTSRPSLIPVTPMAGRLPEPRSMVDVAVTESFLKRLGFDRTEADQVLGTEVEVGVGRQVDGPDGSDGPTVVGLWRRLQVVGVVAQGAGSGQLVTSTELARAQLDWTVGGTDGGRSFDYDGSPYSGVFVVARGIDQVGPAREAISRLGFATSAPENLIASVDNYLGVVEIVLASVGVIALIVAALGIANALLAAVRERRREIGVLKAIGARDRDVLRIFMFEAAVLGFVGGILGTALGIFASRVVSAVVNRYLADQGLAGIAPVLPPEVLVGGIVGPVVIAVLGGVIPARQASRLSPREAVSSS